MDRVLLTLLGMVVVVVGTVVMGSGLLLQWLEKDDLAPLAEVCCCREESAVVAWRPC